LIVGGVIVSAAADELVLDDPEARGQRAIAWLVLGGAALFLVGHAVFKAIVWRVVSWPRMLGAAAVLALSVLAPHTSATTLGVCVLAVLVAVAIADRIMHQSARDDDVQGMPNGIQNVG
jgi:low temperature requirement protein LtrA